MSACVHATHKSRARVTPRTAPGRTTTHTHSHATCLFTPLRPWRSFAMIDTLFSLAEAHLFMQLVEWWDKDRTSLKLPAGKTYADLYR